MGVDVMAKLRGEVKDSDPTASPSRRLGALMRSADEVDAAASREAAAIGSSGSTVIRSPTQVHERAGELQHEVESGKVKMAEVVRGFGPDLVARHGVRVLGRLANGVPRLGRLGGSTWGTSSISRMLPYPAITSASTLGELKVRASPRVVLTAARRVLAQDWKARVGGKW